MNTELKAMLSVLFKLMNLGKDLVEKAGVFTDLADVEALGMAIPPVVSGISGVMAEIDALSDPAHLADILAFVAAQFAAEIGDTKAQAILSASLKLVGDGTSDIVALVEAIKS